MGWLEAIVLGLVQGLTEFLPISSTAHLLLASRLFGWGDPGAAFTAVIQIGTTVAVLIYFRKDIVTIVTTWVRSLFTPELRGQSAAREGWYIILGTIPIGVFGVVFQGQIEDGARDLRIIAATFIGVGLVLGVADRVGRRAKEIENLNIRDGLLYGIAQACALIPGVSRSGATISGGLFLGYTRVAALRYSFLLSIPAVLASGLFEARKIGTPCNTVSWGPTLLSTVIALVVGYASIAWLLRYVATNSFRWFIVYRIVVGLAIIGFLLGGAKAHEPKPACDATQTTSHSRSIVVTVPLP
jgi:undecaprenyl-diphosphatase